MSRRSDSSLEPCHDQKPQAEPICPLAGRTLLALSLLPLAAASSLAKDAASLLPAKYRDAGVIRVQASTVYAPHSFFKPGTTEWTGYEIELFNEVANILGVKAAYTEAPFQQLIAGVKSGRADLSLGDLGDNSLRREQVDFIDHSRLTFQLLISEADRDKIKGVYDLCGRDLGLVLGSTNIVGTALAKCTDKGLPLPNYINYPDATAKDQAIQSGRLPRLDIQATAVGRFRQANGLSKGLSLVPAPEVGDLYIGFIVDKGNEGLAKAVEAALAELWANGKYREILARYDLADLDLPAPGVNIGERASNWKQAKPKS